MICPKCGIADINEDTGRCVLCGYELRGAVQLDAPRDEVREAIEAEVGSQFRIEDVVGVGRRSLVYRARHLRHHHLVAIKVAPLQDRMDPDVVQRFRQEARIAQALAHSHIVPILEFGTTRSVLWYAMEYIDGPSLALLLRDEGPFSLPETIRVLEQVASGLDYLHRCSVVHGNLKPTNVLMDQGRWARVSDAGVLKPGGRGRKGQRRFAVGSPEYVAPEQFELRAGGPAADQYALACMAFECLTGAPPFVGDSTEEIAEKHRSEPPPALRQLVGDLPTSVEDAVQRALAKSPTARFGSILDFVSLMRESPARASAQMFVPATLAITQPAGQEQAARPEQAASEVPPVVLVGGNRRIGPLLAKVAVVVSVIAALVVAGLMQFSGSEPAADGFVQVDRPDELPSREPVVSPSVESDAVPGLPSPEVPPVGRAEESPAPADPVLERTSPTPQRQPVRREAARAPAPGRLFIASIPWGRLFIDGEAAGNTPKANLEVAPGVHVIRIERDAFEPFEVEVRVEPGGEVRLTNIRLQPRTS